LNGEGGTLYFGIDDQGIVQGHRIERKAADEFRRAMSELLKKFTPTVSFPFLSFPFLSFPFLSFPLISFHYIF